jgi:DNA-binding IclR family transcriptional regulator
MKNSRVWGFLTNHAHVLIQIARDPHATVREIALAAGITERATHAVLRDLREAGIVTVKRNGRQNEYKIDVAALAGHRRWGASEMEIPQPLIEATLRGLSRVAGFS